MFVEHSILVNLSSKITITLDLWSGSLAGSVICGEAEMLLRL